MRVGMLMALGQMEKGLKEEVHRLGVAPFGERS